MLIKIHKIIFLAAILFLAGCVQKSIPSIKPKEAPVTRTEIENLNKEIEIAINETDNTVDDISGTEGSSKVVENSALLDKCLSVLADIAIYNHVADSIGEEKISQDDINKIINYCSKNI